MFYVTHLQSLAIYALSQLQLLTTTGYADNMAYDLQEHDKEDNSVWGCWKGSLNDVQRLVEDINQEQNLLWLIKVALLRKRLILFQWV